MIPQQIQSIEDLYIDDDFYQGVSLAANMKLFTQSIDTLNDIDFDLISTHIFEETAESTVTASKMHTDYLYKEREQTGNEFVGKSLEYDSGATDGADTDKQM